MTIRYLMATGVMAGFLAAQPVLAKDEPAQPVPELASLMACRPIAEEAARLACFDRTAAALETATTSGDVVAVNREDLRKTRRSLFGFGSAIGSLFKPFLGNGDGEEDDADEPTRIDTTVASVGGNGTGGLRLRFEEGGTWEQNDMKNFVMSPKVGQKATISKGRFGAYFVSVNGQPGIKMRRVE